MAGQVQSPVIRDRFATDLLKKNAKNAKEGKYFLHHTNIKEVLKIN